MNFETCLKNCGVALVLSATTLVASAASAAPASPFKALAGYWTGNGTVYLQSGAREQVRCRAIYRATNGGRSGSQKLNCQSLAGYGIAARSDMKYAGGRVSGTWTETNYSSSGAVSGSATKSSLALNLSGSAFSAGMQVSFGKCQQNVNISTKVGGIARIVIRLGRC